MRNKLSLLVNFVGVDKLSGSLKSIITNGKEGSKTLKGMQGEAKALGKQLADVQKEMSNSSGNVTELIQRERELEKAIESTNQQIDRRKRLNDIEGNRRSMLAQGDALKSRGQEHMMQGAAMSAPFILAIKAAGDFSSGMVDIQQKAGLTENATAKLGQKILTMSKDAKQLPEDMRAGLDMLLALGGDTLGVDAAVAAMGPAGRLATAYKVEIPDAAAAAYASINNLKVPAKQTAAIFDAMAEAGNQGGFEVKDMARHFPTLTAQMQALGQSGVPAVADLSAALQVAMNTAGGADEAANNIVNLLAKINSPGTIRAFQKNFGVNLPAEMKKLTDSGYTALEAITMVTQKATGSDAKKLAFAFEDRQAQMGILALIQGMDRYREIRAAAMDSGGTVDAAFDQRVLGDANVSWRSFMTTVSALGITLGTTLLPVVSEGLAMINGMVSKVSEWAQANPEVASGIIKAAAGLVVFKVGLGAAIFALGGLLGPLSTGIAIWQKYKLLGSLALVFPKVATGMTLVGKAMAFMMSWPGLIILALAAIAYAVYTNWDTISSAFTNGINKIKTFFSGLPDWFKTIGRNIMAGLLAMLTPGGFARHMVGIAKSGINAFKNVLGIKSPSRVFMALGAHTSEGLARGIEGRGSRATGAMSRLASGVTAAGAIALSPVAAGAVSPAGAGMAGGGLSLSVHIHQQPGENAEALADRVIRLIEQKTATASRRSYEDRD